MEEHELTIVTVIASVTVSTVVWLGLFKICCLAQPRRGYQWNGHCVGFIHGIVMSVLTGFLTLFVNPSAITDPGCTSNSYEVFATVLCVGYFIFDTVWCVCSYNVYRKETSVIAVHHAVAIFGLAVSLILGRSGTEVCCIVFLAEIANPFYHIRWFLREIGVERRNKWYELNDFVFLVTFTGARFFLTPYLVYFMAMHDRTCGIFKTFSVSYCAMNFVQAVQVMQFAFRKYANVLSEWMYGEMVCISPKRERSGVSGNVRTRCQLKNGQYTFDFTYGE